MKDYLINFYKEKLKQLALNSKDSSKVAAYIINSDNFKIISEGFNCFPKNVECTEKRLKCRDTKLEFTVHAEINAIINSKGKTEGNYIITNRFPCSSCMGAIVQAGIIKVYTSDYKAGSKWINSFKTTEKISKESNVKIILI